MSNRRASGVERENRRTRNAPSSKSRGLVIRRRKDGDLVRGEGSANWGYGSQGDGRRTLFTIYKENGRTRRGKADPRARLEAMTRDELRNEAKRRGLAGYGKMNKADLVESMTESKG